MFQETSGQQKMMEEYNRYALPLMEYLPWLEEHVGEDVCSIYEEEGIAENSLCFPVYDETLLRFVKEAAASPLMDKNYPYVYTRNHLGTHDQERKLIQSATWREWGLLKGILSKYVLGGKTKGVLWSDAVKEDIFYLILLQMKKLNEGE